MLNERNEFSLFESRQCLFTPAPRYNSALDTSIVYGCVYLPMVGYLRGSFWSHYVEFPGRHSSKQFIELGFSKLVRMSVYFL